MFPGGALKVSQVLNSPRTIPSTHSDRRTEMTDMLGGFQSAQGECVFQAVFVSRNVAMNKHPPSSQAHGGFPTVLDVSSRTSMSSSCRSRYLSVSSPGRCNQFVGDVFLS